LAIMLSVLLWFMDSDYLFGIFQLFFVLGHYVVCSSLIYGFWLPLWYLPTLLCPFGHYVVCPSLIYAFWLPLCNLQTFLYGLPTANLHNLFETYVVADEYFYMFAIFVDNTLNVLKGTKYIHLC
jgi:hypothetical protein